MSSDSTAQLLVLHAVRIIGFTDVSAIAGRFDLPESVAREGLESRASRGGSRMPRSPS